MQYFAAAALIISFLPAISGAIGSGAHIYVTENVFGSNDVDLLYGSIAPDLSIYVPESGAWTTGFEDTHYNYVELWPRGWEVDWKRFSMGWMVHNEIWGADYYSHIEYPAGSGMPGYVIQKASMLAPLIPIPDPDLRMEIAHTAVEFAIDVLVQEHLDNQLGMKLQYINSVRSDRDLQRLFNILAAKGKVTDRKTLSSSEQAFRRIVQLYSGALAASSVNDMSPLAQLGSNMAWELYGVVIPPEQVLALLNASMSLCAEDFDEFIEEAVEGIREELDLH